METRNNYIIFDNDDEFYNAVVVQELKVKQNNGIYYTDWDFSSLYNKAIEDGKEFIIRDEDSQIVKRGEVAYRLITKPIDNLKPYYGEQFIEI